MGDTCRLRSDDVVPFVDPSQQDAAEVDRPNAIGHLLEADRVLLEGVGDEHQPFLEPDRPSVGDALDDEVPRVLEWGEFLGVGPRRRGVAGAWGTAAEVLVRPFVVVEGAEALKARCWAARVAAGRRRL